MRFRALTVLVAGATALTMAMAFGPEAGAATQGHPAGVARGHAHIVAPSRPNAVLYSQNDNDAGVGIVSQNFESSFDQYDASGADDFKIPKKHTWTISAVDVTGVYFNGPGPCRDETVTFYKSTGGFPGTVLASQTASGSGSGGSFSIPVNVAIKAGRRAKKVWVGVVCNMDFGVGGEWGWETRTVQGGKYPAAWENPGGGFGIGCTTWGVMQTCIGQLGEGPDFMFAIEGTQT